MRNPWVGLLPRIRPSYILSSDKQLIKDFNQKQKIPDFMMREYLIPEPFIGNKDAKIILLSLNPGFHTDDKKFHKKKKFRDAVSNNLRHSNQNSDYPFYLLNPEFKDSPGYQYWFSRLGPLIDEVGQKTVARKIFSLELFPYHSERFRMYDKFYELESIKYTRKLVEDAIKRNKIIIILRARKKWEQVVPHLRKYKNLLELNSYGNSQVSKKNLPRGSFLKVVQQFKKS